MNINSIPPKKFLIIVSSVGALFMIAGLIIIGLLSDDSASTPEYQSGEISPSVYLPSTYEEVIEIRTMSAALYDLKETKEYNNLDSKHQVGVDRIIDLCAASLNDAENLAVKYVEERKKGSGKSYEDAKYAYINARRECENFNKVVRENIDLGAAASYR